MAVSVKDRLMSVKEVFHAIEKQFGEGAIMRLGSAPSGADVPSFPSGSLSLDVALGIGGYPRGRIIEIYGPESSGKTTLTLHAAAEVQKKGGVCAFVDAEHALDVTYAQKLGVDVNELLVSQPDYGEQALEITDKLASCGAVDLVVVDSVAALTPKAELEGEMGDHHVGLQARMMSQAMRKLTSCAHKTGTTLIFINQIRHKIGVQFGTPETTTGGNALKFYASVRLDVRRHGKIKSKDNPEETVGNKTVVKVVKNKMAPPFRNAEFEILFGTGIHRIGEVLDMGSDLEFVQKSGAHYSIDGVKLGHGRDNALKYLVAHPEVTEPLSAQILAKRLGREPATPTAEHKNKQDGKAA